MSLSNSKLLTKGIRFDLDRKVPLVVIDAYVNGEGPFKFVVDTGASVTVISPEVARSARVDEGAKSMATGASGNLEVRAARLRSLKLGTTELKRVGVAIMSLDALNGVSRTRIGGIVGYNAEEVSNDDRLQNQADPFHAGG